MTSLKKLRKQQRTVTPVSQTLKLIEYFTKLKDQELLVVKNQAIYIYKVLLTLGDNPTAFVKNLYMYAVATGLISHGDKLLIVDIETDEILN